MPEPYSDAAIRHFQDAHALAQNNRFDSAGHLIGFATECAIKYSVEALRPTNTAPHLHIPELLEKAKKLLKGRRKHSMVTLLESPKFMVGWNIGDRYSDNGTVDRTRYMAWHVDASRALAVAGLRRKTQ